MSEQQYTVDQILDRYERDCLHELAPRTQKDYRRHLPTLSKWFGKRIADELRPRDFAEFLNVTKGKQQRNKQLAILSSAFSQAVGFWFWIERNVLRDVRRHPSKPRDRLILDHEFQIVRLLMPLRVQLMMDLALRTGQRQGDILRMKWSDIKDGALHVQQSKTGKRLAIKLGFELKKVLGRCAALGSSEYLIVNEAGHPYTSDGFRALWQRGMRKATRGYWMSSRSKRHFIEPVLDVRFTFHDIRAMAATKCKTIQEASTLLGHSNLSMTRKVYRRGIEQADSLEFSIAA
jgi:integrase